MGPSFFTVKSKKHREYNHLFETSNVFVLQNGGAAAFMDIETRCYGF